MIPRLGEALGKCVYGTWGVHPSLKAYITCVCHLQVSNPIHTFWMDKKKEYTCNVIVRE